MPWYLKHKVFEKQGKLGLTFWPGTEKLDTRDSKKIIVTVLVTHAEEYQITYDRHFGGALAMQNGWF